MLRPSHLFAVLVPLAALTACNDETSNFVFAHGANVAVVRFVNATDVPITVTGNGVIDTTDANIAFGRQTACLIIDLSTPTPLTFTNGLTTVVIPGFVAPPITGGSFTIVAFSALNGPIQFATLNNAFAPNSGDAGLRFFNAASTAGTLVMNGNGFPLTSGVNFGFSSGFVNVAPPTLAVTFTNGTTTVLDAGTQPFTAPLTSTIVVGNPAVGSTALRFFTTPSC
jgi:hypothetical protein